MAVDCVLNRLYWGRVGEKGRTLVKIKGTEPNNAIILLGLNT